MELDYYDLRLLNSLLSKFDEDGTLGTCADWMDGEYCRMCTLLMRLDDLERRLRDAEGEVLHTDDSI